MKTLRTFPRGQGPKGKPSNIETSDMSEDRPKLCDHGISFNKPCHYSSCNRTLESIRVAEFADGLVDGLRDFADKLHEADDSDTAVLIESLSNVHENARIKCFGKGGG